MGPSSQLSLLDLRAGWARSGSGRLRFGSAAFMVLTVLAGVAMIPHAAQGHPFGEPQTVRVTAEGSVVRLTWSAPPDDLVLLGGVVGALPERRQIIIDNATGGDPEPVGASVAELITSSPEVKAYLEEHLSVRQNGQACPPDVSFDQLVGDGAHVSFQCPLPVSDVDIEITMLTDIHEAYRTAAIGIGATDPERVLYTVDDTVRRWSFGETEPTRPILGPEAWVGLCVVAGAVLAYGVRAWRLRK